MGYYVEEACIEVYNYEDEDNNATKIMDRIVKSQHRIMKSQKELMGSQKELTNKIDRLIHKYKIMGE